MPFIVSGSCHHNRKSHHEKNKERVRAAWRKYYHEHKDRILMQCKKYRDKNKEKIRDRKAKRWKKNRRAYLEQKRMYYRRNRESILASIKLYRTKNSAKVKERKATWYRENRLAILKKNKVHRMRPSSKDKAKKLRTLRRLERAAYEQRRRIRKYGNSTADQIREAEEKIRILRTSMILPCCYCDRKFPSSDLEVEHIIPISRGGGHDARNVALACARCNSSKNDRLLMTEWVPEKLRKIKDVFWPSTH